MSRRLSIIGIVLTTAYFLLLCFIFSGRITEILLMAPNETGDLLAGMFGPLAILWLILGFFQQGIELRQNTKALELQAEELKHSVEQQRELVDVSRKQFEADLEVVRYERERQLEAARPKLIFHGVGAIISGANAKYRVQLENLGNVATDVSLHFQPEPAYYDCKKIVSLKRHDSKELNWWYSTPYADSSLTLTISYIDSSGLLGKAIFDFIPKQDGDYKMVEIIPRTS